MDKSGLQGTMADQQASVGDAVEAILENLPTEVEEVVDLPSRGKFYTLKNPSDGISVRPMNFGDEKAIVQAANKDSINVLISRCVNNVDVSELLQFDKLYLLLKIRENSFGTQYTVPYLCETCDAHSDVTFDIGQFRVNKIEEDLEDPREVHLEKINKKAKVRFPRVRDEVYLADTTRIMDNMWRFVESIDDNTNKAVISKVIQQLPSKDVHILMNEIFGTDYGLDTQGKFTCDHCGHVQTAELPIGTDFFTLS